MSLRKAIRNARKATNYGIGQPPRKTVEDFVANLSDQPEQQPFAWGEDVQPVPLKFEANDGRKA